MIDRTQSIVVWTGRICALCIPLAAAAVIWRLELLKPTGATRVDTASPSPAAGLQPGPHIAAESWRVFYPAATTAAVDAGSVSPFASRYRLAGTFFAFGEAAEVSGRAIIDDLTAKQQAIVRVGDQLDTYRLVEVSANQATFEKPGDRVTLTLGFLGPAGPARAGAMPAGTPGSTEDEERVLEQTVFGKRVSETRWILNRQALMAYYQDLLENPERVAALYSSMKPDYRNEEIAGYRVNQEGERDFFKAMGLAEGDVVRKVNSMNMTSQSRAEYFIGEFVKSRLNAVVLDIDRAGKTQKMIYLIR